MTKYLRHAMKSAVVLAALLTGAGTAHAWPLYSTTFQGVTFTFNQTDPNTLKFNLADTGAGLLGDWSGATHLGAFDLKDLGLDFTTATGTAYGPGIDPNLGLAGINDQVSGSSLGMVCDSPAQPTGGICFNINPDYLLPQPFNLTYTIDFSSALNIASTGPHLQILFTDDSASKIGSLYSESVGAGVPEPGTLALMGFGLLGLAGLRQRRAADRRSDQLHA